MESEVCPMDSLKTAFSPPCLSLTFVPKGLMDSKGCPMESFNTAFSSACPSHDFCP